MSSFFGRLKATTASGTAAAGGPTKKDPNAPQPTPLEKLLHDVGPLRTDGSDKFFGFENFGSTCYCNSIIQCLYYSAPFREQVISFPAPSPLESLRRPKPEPAPTTPDPAHSQGLNAKARNFFGASPASPAAKAKPAVSPGPGPPGLKPEDNKDSPEYKKKQAMAAGPVITMDYENSTAYGMKESLFTSLKDIFEAVIAHQSRIGVVSPHKFLEILRRDNEMFRTPMHQDAHEFLNLLLNEVVENVEQFSKQLEEDAQKPKPNPEQGLNEAVMPVINATVPEVGSKTNGHRTKWVHDLFEGTLTSETRCLTCENTSQRDEAFLDLSVDLEQHTSVTSCLRKFSEEEMLCERNKFHCDKCGGLQEAEKRMKVKRLPRILALHLKRFKYTEDLQRLQKLFHRVVYPYYLRLFNTTDDAEDPDRLYELYAVVVHIGGGPYHGHYVSIIKTHDHGWLLFDDEMVEPVDKSYVRNFFGGEGNLACAYVLFYQETTMEAMQAELDAEGVAAMKAPEHGKEASAINPKANGAPNGVLHLHTPATPILEDHEHFAKLDHAMTAPASVATPPSPIPFRPPLETAPTSPTFPFLNRKKSDIFAKKEAERLAKEQEKQRRQDEKETEKKRRKELEQRRRDYHKRQEDDMKAAIAASQTGASTPATPTAQSDTALPTVDKLPAPAKETESVASSSTSNPFGLHRFRRTSRSLRHKPKLFGGSSQKDKDSKAHKLPQLPQPPPQPQQPPGVDQQAPLTAAPEQDATASTPLSAAAAVTPTTPADHPATPASATVPASSSSLHHHVLPPLPRSATTPLERERKPSHGQSKDKDRERFRFSLGRKKSSHLGM